MARTVREFLKKQKDLDILTAEKRDVFPPYTDANQNGDMLIACLVEIGELANELSFFKYWKKNKNVNMDKVKDEYADVMHFILALNNIDKLQPKIGATLEDLYNKTTKVSNMQKLFHELYQLIVEFKSGEALVYLMMLGKSLDMTYDDIEKAYDDKNKINYDRMNGGY